MPAFPVITMQRFDFKNRITATKLFLVMVLNQYLTSESLSKSHFVDQDFHFSLFFLQHMTKLQSDGLELVTNIQVAVDARDSDWRTGLEEACRLRRDKLENEAKSSQEKFEEITRKWTDAKMKQTPLDLRDALNSQQQLCEQIVADKNKLISELQQELKASDDRYVKDLKKQAKDIDLIIERMEEQISSLKKSYLEDLEQIEVLNCLLQNMLQGLSLLEEHEDLLQKLRVQKAEEYNTDKIKMDTEVQNLRKKLQEVKFNCHLNEEKLDYKYEVLKKREEENTILKSQLKRKIIRMQDILNNLKSKCANQEKQSKAEEQSLRNDYARIKQQYKDMQKKERHFAALDAERFEKIWLISEGEVKAMAHRALETDRIIHEQQLGLAWVSPPLPFMEHSGPIEHKTLKTASQAAADTLQEETGDSVEESEGLEDTGSGVNRRTVKRILELLCDELVSGFLVESKLLKLVSHLEKNEQSLIKLDCIFTAIGIESENDVHKMAEFLMNYRQRGREENDSGDTAYWECIANVIPESKLRLWSALDTALNKYHTILTERAKLLAETQNVQQQNTELRQLLHLYTTSKASAEPEMQPTRM
uniref:Dynein regulatory complex protein 1 n=1 Tax=Sinocyclocheilus anshuiensis TaxID=1608454 RepID=A0A671QQX2_9TELE